MIAYDKFPDQQKAEYYHTIMVTQEEMLKQSDIISIHIPATEETEEIINKETIKLMKPGVYLVNTARGSIVREADVYEGLKSGKIAGYGTDVYEKGTLPDENPLFEFSGYIATPYISAETYENYAETGIVTAKALIAVLSGREPENKLV